MDLTTSAIAPALPPRSPAAVRAARASALLEQRRGHPPFDLDAEMRAAEDATGLSCWSTDPLVHEGLRRLCASIDGESGLDALGRALWAADLRRWLTNHLRQEAQRRDGPPPAPPTTVPTFIVGFGRTGSTLLQNLLALDPTNRAPTFSEMFYLGAGHQAHATAALDRIGELSPDIFHLHQIAADRPDECHYLFDSAFASPHFCMYYHAPTYWDWVREHRGAAGRSTYPMFAALMARRFALGARRWVGKSLIHQFFYQPLLDTFPGAQLIRLHRTPDEAIASLCSLLARYRGLYADHRHLPELGRFVLELFVDGAREMRRADASLEPGQACDIGFRELSHAPLDAVRRLYAHFGWTAEPAFLADVAGFLAANPAGRHGPHRARLEDFGLNRAQVLAATTDYTDWAGPRGLLD